MSIKTIPIYTMQDYCENLKKYIDFYQANPLNVGIYGDKRQQLKDAINDTKMDEMLFVLVIEELVGGVTRVIQGGNPNIPFFQWIGGGNESFTREHFITTLNSVWPEL